MTRSRIRSLWMDTFLLVALACGLVTACGPATPEAAPRPSGPTPTVTVPAGMPVVVAMAGRFGGRTLAVLDQQIAAFEAANPDIKVEIVAAPTTAAERRERFLAQLEQEDNSVDVLVLNDSWLAEFAAGGWLSPLDGYVRTQGLEMDDFLAASVQAVTFDGQLLALPWATDAGLLYYRQDLLDKYGYDPPSTWADLQRIALEVKGREGLPYGFVWQGAAYETLTYNTLEFVWAYGGDVLDKTGNVVFDTPQTRAALQQMADLIISGASPQGVTAYDEGKTTAVFKNGDAVFMRNWSSAWARLNDGESLQAGQVSVIPLPASCLFEQNLALSAYSLHPEQAFRWMAFLAGYQQQVQVALHGGQPPALEAAYGDADLLAHAPVLKALHAALSVARPRPRSVAYSELSKAIYTEVHRMLAGDQDAETTAARVQRRIEALPHPNEKGAADAAPLDSPSLHR